MKVRYHKRLAVLAERSGTSRVGGIVNMLAGETEQQAAARAVAEGRVGPSFAVVPAVLPVDEWEAQAMQTTAYQAGLIRELMAQHPDLLPAYEHTPRH